MTIYYLYIFNFFSLIVLYFYWKRLWDLFMRYFGDDCVDSDS